MVDVLLPLDRDDASPLHRQLSTALERAILRGAFQDGQPLPSSRRLADDLAVSRNTVNAAYADLIAQGLVASRPRQGLFVDVEAHRALGEVQPDDAVRTGHDWARALARGARPDVEHISKITDWHRYPHPFLAGQPDVSLFPTVEWTRALKEALRPEMLPGVLQDAQWQDDPMLVEMVCRTIAPQRGLTANPEDVLITLGSQHALHLVSQVLVRAGVRVAMEDPGYVDARNIFLLSGGDVLPVPVDEGGIVVDPRVSRTDMVYVTPSHQYPTNATMSFSRRKRILAAAREHDFLVIEDDYDQEFRYRGTPTVALKALDSDSRVIYLSSFSKALAPGVRLGFVIADPALIAELRMRARYSVRHPPGQLQRALAQFIATGQYGRHLRRVKKHYKRKWEACTAAIDHHFDWCTQRFPPGGMSVWVQGPESMDAHVLAEHAEREGVLIEPGTVCFLRRPRPANYFKLGFAAIPLEAIEPGIATLAQIVRRLSG